MAETLSKGNLFPKELITDLINKVKGASVLQQMSAQEPIAFNGNQQFIFTFDKDIDIVAENGEKGVGGIGLKPITVTPVKFEYGARISEEAWYASEESQIDILKGFNEGYAKKLAKGLDLAAIYGMNPRTKAKSDIITDFALTTDRIIKENAGMLLQDPTVYIEDAIAKVESNDAVVNGIIISPQLRSAMGKVRTQSGEPIYREFGFGGVPSNLNGLSLAVSGNLGLEFDNKTIHCLAGDWSTFKWGIAKNIDLRIITAGDPDGQGDLSRNNQIYLRAETYLGWTWAASDVAMTIEGKDA